VCFVVSIIIMTFLMITAQTTFSEAHVDNLEKWIDEMSESLPPLTNFILPVCFTVQCFPSAMSHSLTQVQLLQLKILLKGGCGSCFICEYSCLQLAHN